MRRPLASSPSPPLAALAAVAAGSAFAHAQLSPPVALARSGQLFSLAVPTEKENATTTKVVLTVPDGFSIDSFVAAPGLEARGAVRPARARTPSIQKVTWTPAAARADRGGRALPVPRPRPTSAKTYTFEVEQTYSDGSVVDWTGARELRHARRRRSRRSQLARRRRQLELDARDRRARRRRRRRRPRRDRPRSQAERAAARLRLGAAAPRARRRRRRSRCRRPRPRTPTSSARCPSASGIADGVAAERRADLQRGGRAALRDRLRHRRGRATRWPTARRRARRRTRTRSSSR